MIYKGGFGTGATAPTIADVNAILAGYAGTTPYPGSGPYLGAIGVNTDGNDLHDRRARFARVRSELQGRR